LLVIATAQLMVVLDKSNAPVALIVTGS